MLYSFQLFPHANIRYTEALNRLGCKELLCLLHALGLSAQVEVSRIGRGSFLSFESDPLSGRQLSVLASHSSLLLMSENQSGCLRPLDVPETAYLPPDLSEVLKYKGKTSARFTKMMITCALTASGKAGQERELTLLDPLCGKGTTLFCALERGMNAFGLDADRRAVEEADTYLKRYLELHRFKHQRTASSLTAGSRPVRCVSYTLADTREHYRDGAGRTVGFAVCDTADAGALLRRHPADLLVTDLPYGVQHAPGEQGGIMRFDAFLSRVLPAWHASLRPGAALAMSMNTYTLRKETAVACLERAGFSPLLDPPYDDFSHDVEQAVRRDFVVALRP